MYHTQACIYVKYESILYVCIIKSLLCKTIRIYTIYYFEENISWKKNNIK